MTLFVRCGTILFLALAGFWCGSASVHAESRSIGVKITWLPDPKTHALIGGQGIKVSIYSEVKGENKRNISVAEAAAILEKAQGWGSMVDMGVISDAQLADYLPLLDAMAKNGWLELAFICRSDDRPMLDRIKKYTSIGLSTK